MKSPGELKWLKQAPELRVFVDRLREVLQLSPLYGFGNRS